MNRLVWTFLFLSCFGAIQAQQGFKLGIHGSLPVAGDANDAVNLVAGIDTGYMFALG